MQPSQLRACLEVALGPVYRIEREVRPSGASRRFVAHDITGGSSVLVRVLPAELAQAVDAERLEREVGEIAPRLRHPRIVPSRGAGAAGPFVYHVRPFVAGTTLGARLTRGGALPLHEAVRILRDVLHALSHAHGLGLAHGDLQPDQVVLVGRRAQLADVGLAAALVAAARAATAPPVLALCLPAYVSPERRSGTGSPDVQDDVYAVGALAYEMLIGEPPADPAAQPLTRRRDSVPLVLGEVVAGCLVPDPAKRWSGPEDILEELNRLTGA